MREAAYRAAWLREEKAAHITGWNFAHIEGRYEQSPMPWDYRQIVMQYLRPDMHILDYDTGGGEFLLSLGHPPERTAATEGFGPNVRLCRARLTPLGIDFRACSTPERIPFADASFDLMLNRHGGFDARECHRLLRAGGVLITEQVGGDNDRDLIEWVLPGADRPFAHLNLREQRGAFERAGFQILRAQEAYRPVRFYDVGAFVWFARVIEWEFPGFGVDACFDRLCEMQKAVEARGNLEGTVHRYLIVAKKEAGGKRPADVQTGGFPTPERDEVES